MNYIVKILKIEQVTHDVKRFVLEKPEGFKFIPGQASYSSINKPKWKHEERPFTFTCLNAKPYLEFTIKNYPRGGVTEQIHKLKPDDELILHDVFGTIDYKGRGVFIAGGAGVTPFIAILRQLKKDNQLKGNKLIFSNKTGRDVILEKEFKQMFRESPEDLILTLTEEDNKNYENRFVNEEFLKEKIKNFSQYFYICGPPKMVKSIRNILKKISVKQDLIVFEKF